MNLEDRVSRIEKAISQIENLIDLLRVDWTFLKDEIGTENRRPTLNTEPPEKCADCGTEMKVDRIEWCPKCFPDWLATEFGGETAFERHLREEKEERLNTETPLPPPPNHSANQTRERSDS